MTHTLTHTTHIDSRPALQGFEGYHRIVYGLEPLKWPATVRVLQSVDLEYMVQCGYIYRAWHLDWITRVLQECGLGLEVA